MNILLNIIADHKIESFIVALLAAVVVIEAVERARGEINMKKYGYHDPSIAAEGAQWMLMIAAVITLMLIAIGGIA